MLQLFGAFLKSLLLLCLFSASLIAAFDEAALQRESNKKIEKVDIDEITRSYNDIQKAIDEAEAQMYDGSGIDYDCFSDEEYLFIKDPEGPVAPIKTVNNNEDLERRIQTQINLEILALIKSNTVHGPAMKESYLAMRVNKKYPSDIAYLLGQYLKEQGDYSNAIDFFNLMGRSHRYMGEEALAIGDALVTYINVIIEQTRPTSPTAQLFSAVQKAIRAYHRGIHACEIGYFFAGALTNIRDMMVRWPLSPKKLLDDSYYDREALVSRVYAHDFVPKLLEEIKTLDKIVKSYKFTINGDDGNLLTALENAGFKGIYKSLGYNNQYIWANPKGFIVRIKYDDGKKSNKAGEWQFTVALCYTNPFVWKGPRATAIMKAGDLNPVQDAKYYNDAYKYDDLASFEYNEIFKIVVDGQLVMIAPAFRNFYWYLQGSTLGEVMAKAHKKLNAVGDAAKLGPRCMLESASPRNQPAATNFVVGGAVRQVVKKR
jgi:tetratricopeptide (TPR) repeat protein